MRPSSQRQSSTSSQKPGFQTKLKSRPGAVLDLQNYDASIDSRMSKTHRSFHQHQESIARQDNFNKTASLLSNSNFSHHNQGTCVCSDCNCGRHLCKLHVIKPDLTKNTIYQRSFHEQRAIPNIVNHDKQYDKLKGPHLDMRSTYGDGFRGKKGDSVEKPHPEDLLNSNGPSLQLSSYKAQFPGYKGSNQYVKPTNRHTRGFFPLRSKSTYTKEFRHKEHKKDDYKYMNDQLKTGTNWFGKSTYGDSFATPNPEYMANKIKFMEKKQDNPDYSRQYETVYKNDFLGKSGAVCPAKIILETTAQGNFRDTKNSFSQNCDYKALSPDFHAISTSKHSYV